MQTADFDFLLPASLIAQEPARPRGAARLLVVGTDDELTDMYVRDLTTLLRPGDLLLLNDTRVLPSLLQGKRGQAKVTLTLHQQQATAGEWLAFARPAKRLRPGDLITIAPDFTVRILACIGGGEVRVALETNGTSALEALHSYGRVPLPPYIRRPDGITATDANDYQTVFSRHDGAVAAPTAGLHLTWEVLDRLEQQGIAHAAVTLHVGAGTFLPVKTDNPHDHIMHAEWGEITPLTADRINKVRREGGRIIAVGTTVLRVIESQATEDGTLAPWRGETSLFVLPGYRFRVVDHLLTNFHLPRSTLFMLVSAFAGTTRIRRAYQHAITRGYRFFSYGDACFLSLSRDPAA